MSRIQVEAERVIAAPADAIYALLADYRQGHPSILPPENFVDYRVEEGGRGAGTIASFRVRAGGRERGYRIQVSEPTPGGILVERDLNSSLVTTFSLVPVSGGQQTRIRIRTEWQGGRGVGGFFERTFAPMAMRRIYTHELDLLTAAVTGDKARGDAPASQTVG
jgi:polyketide cyclase/dehydrase/lipid transport protein